MHNFIANRHALGWPTDIKIDQRPCGVCAIVFVARHCDWSKTV